MGVVTGVGPTIAIIPVRGLVGRTVDGAGIRGDRRITSCTLPEFVTSGATLTAALSDGTETGAALGTCNVRGSSRVGTRDE